MSESFSFNACIGRQIVLQAIKEMFGAKKKSAQQSLPVESQHFYTWLLETVVYIAGLWLTSCLRWVIMLSGGRYHSHDTPLNTCHIMLCSISGIELPYAWGMVYWKFPWQHMSEDLLISFNQLESHWETITQKFSLFMEERKLNIIYYTCMTNIQTEEHLK